MPTAAAAPQRVVSLIPAASEIVSALGQADRLVGRSHECDFPPGLQSLPVLTRPAYPSQGNSRAINQSIQGLLQQSLSVYEVDAAKLAGLAPELVITQTQCDVCAVSEDAVKDALANLGPRQPALLSLAPNTLADVLGDIRRVADALGEPARGEQFVADLQERMEAVKQRVYGLESRPRLAMIEWLEPLMAAGNWMPELAAVAGGEPVPAPAGVHSPWLQWETLREADPGVIALMPCGFTMADTRRDLHFLTERPGWNELQAVQNQRVYLVEGNQYFNRPGPRLADSVEILAELLHPEHVPPRHRGSGWEPL